MNKSTNLSLLLLFSVAAFASEGEGVLAQSLEANGHKKLELTAAERRAQVMFELLKRQRNATNNYLNPAKEDLNSQDTPLEECLDDEDVERFAFYCRIGARPDWETTKEDTVWARASSDTNYRRIMVRNYKREALEEVTLKAFAGVEIECLIDELNELVVDDEVAEEEPRKVSKNDIGETLEWLIEEKIAEAQKLEELNATYQGVQPQQIGVNQGFGAATIAGAFAVGALVSLMGIKLMNNSTAASQ